MLFGFRFLNFVFMVQISQETKKLILRYQIGEKSSRVADGTPTIHVDEVASKVAAFYEKIRGVIDWREEHLLKKSAIERILKRRIMAGADLLKTDAKESIAQPLVLDLIRGGHYPNDRIPEIKIGEVQAAIEKYIFVLRNTPQAENGERALNFYNWILSIASCEIEQILSSYYKEKALIDFMFDSIKDRVVLNQGAITTKAIKEDEKNIQIYIAVQRALFKLDASVISYHLLKYKYPNWRNINQGELMEISKNMLQTQDKIQRDLVHPLADKFYNVCEKYDTPYLLLGDIISEDGQNIEEKLSNPEALEESIRDAYKKRVLTLKSRLSRAAIYATISIFITKVILALAIEIPIDRYLHSFNGTALALNILVPPALMFFLVSTIKVPGKENLERVVLETMKIVQETDRKDTYEIKTFKVRRNFLLSSIIDFAYLVSFVVSIGVIVWVLDHLNFSALSIIIFIAFISLISFAGTRIRQRSKELQIIEEREGVLGFISDFFAIPIVEFGKWLSGKWQKYNFVSVLFDILVDMPFAIFVEFIEQWRYFLKERKESIH